MREEILTNLTVYLFLLFLIRFFFKYTYFKYFTNILVYIFGWMDGCIYMYGWNNRTIKDRMNEGTNERLMDGTNDR